MRSEMKQGVQQGELAANGVCRTDTKRAVAKMKKKENGRKTARFRKILCVNIYEYFFCSCKYDETQVRFMW